jgi:hypothetical protein
MMLRKIARVKERSRLVVASEQYVEALEALFSNRLLCLEPAGPYRRSEGCVLSMNLRVADGLARCISIVGAKAYGVEVDIIPK